MTALDIRNKISKKREDIRGIKKEKEELITETASAVKKFENKEWEIFREVNNLLEKLSLQVCRFKCYTDVIFRGVPAQIAHRGIDPHSFKVFYKINVNGEMYCDIYEDDPDLDDVDLTRSSLRSTILSQLHKFIEKFNPVTHKWFTKKDWEDYDKWVKNYKKLVIIIKLSDSIENRTPNTIHICVPIHEFFIYIDNNRTTTIEDIHINGKNCKYCKLIGNCRYIRF